MKSKVRMVTLQRWKMKKGQKLNHLRSKHSYMDTNYGRKKVRDHVNFFVSSKPGAHIIQSYGVPKVFVLDWVSWCTLGTFPGSQNIHGGRHEPHLWLRLEVGEKHLLRPFNELDLCFFLSQYHGFDIYI